MCNNAQRTKMHNGQASQIPSPLAISILSSRMITRQGGRNKEGKKERANPAGVVDRRRSSPAPVFAKRYPAYHRFPSSLAECFSFAHLRRLVTHRVSFISSKFRKSKSFPPDCFVSTTVYLVEAKTNSRTLFQTADSLFVCSTACMLARLVSH